MKLFLHFTIVIPAHNEELYISDTLEHILALDYPQEKLETIVIENGSTDSTLRIATKFECLNMRILRSPVLGISAARNYGLQEACREGDWIIFADADVLLERDFLKELNAYLAGSDRHVIGTTGVRPFPETPQARKWFAFYDTIHRLTKSSYSIIIAKRSLFPPVAFDETLRMGEDIKLINDALAFGDFFFLPTRAVSASTRRFNRIGYWKLFFFWTFVACLPTRLKRLVPYAVVR